ncbi:hypothetical protein [Rhodopirellula sallentina]|uniref:Secreted protein n=1 Tax=Rhodopirellula sallentina SM41 TaxID=1263870 RepID=M5U1K8_9BACT|nr:hypothetical protein [Rhodopirellula sallentina]EMI51726.1 secreted protein [Rhodopirellula sallentina SM41]
MNYRHLYRSSILVMLAAAAVCVLGLRSVTSHSHSDGDKGHTHAALPHGLIPHVHPAEHAHSHGRSHQHAHAHSHDHAHEHSHPHSSSHPPSQPTIGSSHPAPSDDRPTLAKTSDPYSSNSSAPHRSATLTAASHHSHYVFFGFEFILFESAAQKSAAYGSTPYRATRYDCTPRDSISHDGFCNVDLRGWLARIFDVRSPLPPESLASAMTPSSIRFHRTLCLNGGRLDDPPSSPPPELVSH